MEDGRLALVVSLCFASCKAQTTYTVSSPQYSTMHYMLMAASFFLIASLVLGILVLVRNDCARPMQVRAKAGKPSRSRRQQVIEVQPKAAGPDKPEFAVSDQDLIVEDLDGHLIRTVASSMRTTPR